MMKSHYYMAITLPFMPRRRAMLFICFLFFSFAQGTIEHVYASDKDLNDFSSINGLMQDMADKAFKNMKPEDLPYFKNDPNADCSKFVRASLKKFAKLEIMFTEMAEAKKANNISTWDKIKAANGLRILLQYAVIDRSFAAKRCVDGFEETAFPKLDRIVDEYNAIASESAK